MFQKSDIHYLNTVLREVRNLEQTQEIKLSDGMPDIGRVVASWGMPIIRGKEWHSDRIVVSGGVMIWALYAPEDGTDPRCVETWVPFRMEWDIPGSDADGHIRVQPLLRFVDARSVSARKMMVRVGIGAMAEALVPGTSQVSESDATEADIQLLRNTYPVRLVRFAGEKPFLLDEDLTVPGSCPKPDKLICYSVQPEITETSVNGDRVVFKGNANLHILYRCGEGRLHTWDFDLPFSQLGNIDSADDENTKADVLLCATTLEVQLEEDGHLRLKCGLLGQFTVDKRMMITLTEDAYGLQREVTPQMNFLELPVLLESRQENIYAEQIIPQEGDQIVDVCSLPDFPRQRRQGDSVELELPGQFQVLYYGEDGFLQSSTARWETNTRIPMGEDATLCARILPKGRPGAMLSGGQIHVKSSAILDLQSSSMQRMPMVTGLEIGQPMKQDMPKPSLILRRAGEEGLWKLAKDSGSTMDAIRQVNGLTSDPVQGQMLLIPVG